MRSKVPLDPKTGQVGQSIGGYSRFLHYQAEVDRSAGAVYCVNLELARAGKKDFRGTQLDEES